MKPAGCLLLAALLVSGCDNMQHQQNVRTMTPSDHFSNDAWDPPRDSRGPC
jgi:hypothetical protein